jgi:hypothetical protein
MWQSVECCGRLSKSLAMLFHCDSLGNDTSTFKTTKFRFSGHWSPSLLSLTCSPSSLHCKTQTISPPSSIHRATSLDVYVNNMWEKVCIRSFTNIVKRKHDIGDICLSLTLLVHCLWHDSQSQEQLCVLIGSRNSSDLCSTTPEGNELTTCSWWCICNIALLRWLVLSTPAFHIPSWAELNILTSSGLKLWI